ncbi:DUF2637 domain-containing protein [Kitasatospora viridis]|uniref:Uncharacterized protein DUF2637 n=1 Tax=Kitasatospora viridis TaxID=281105 RepID=A0A561UIC4_9ACTN|nr:DUF2637 domain-containing protein [Kitasatospora viridis]TWF99097.1 uncharacterized protein DUF2637 [Kitasatospora viridis]
MPSTTPAARPTGFGAFAYRTVTLVMAVTAGLAFAFSFGNVWALARRLAIPAPVAPLIAPMVDLSVVGLMVARNHLSATGTDTAELRSANRLMHLCGLLTIALNTAEPVLARHYGRALLDAVAPVLLLGWSTVGPKLLHLLHAPAPDTATERARAEHAEGEPNDDRAAAPQPVPEADASAEAEPDEDVPPVRREPVVGGKRTGRRPGASMEELAALTRPAVAEQGATHAVVKQAVRDAGKTISSDRLGELVHLLKAEQEEAAA